MRHAITRRMKRLNARWSVRGGEHMARLRAAYMNGELERVTRRRRWLSMQPTVRQAVGDEPVVVPGEEEEEVGEWLQATMPALKGPYASRPWIKYILRQIGNQATAFSREDRLDKSKRRDFTYLYLMRSQRASAGYRIAWHAIFWLISSLRYSRAAAMYRCAIYTGLRPSACEKTNAGELAWSLTRPEVITAHELEHDASEEAGWLSAGADV